MTSAHKSPAPFATLSARGQDEVVLLEELDEGFDDDFDDDFDDEFDEDFEEADDDYPGKLNG